MSCGGSWVELPAAPVSEALVACSVACKVSISRQSCELRRVYSENVLKDRLPTGSTWHVPAKRTEREVTGKCTVPFTSGNL
jgi:hypothetical protein